MNSKRACEKWIELINMAIIYTKFWRNLWIKEPRAFVYYVQEYLNNDNIIEIEDISCNSDCKSGSKIKNRVTDEYTKIPRLINKFEEYNVGVTSDCMNS